MRCTARLLAILAIGLGPLACRRDTPAPVPPAADRPAPATILAPDTPTVDAPGLTLRLHPLLDPTPRLAVELTARGLADLTWELTALVAAELRDLRISDDTGDVPFTRASDGATIRITLARAPRGPLHITYVLHATPITTLPADVPAALTLRIDNTRIFASGEELLLLPSSPHAEPISLQLALTATPAIPRLVTTLGVEPGTPTHVRLHELRHAGFLAGETGHALLRGPAGEDDFAWTGDTHFDLRWSAAETAGARTAVDAYFGVTPDETTRFTALLSVDVELPGTGVLVVPRGGGLYVALTPGARWDGPARLAVAQGLVHRWIGGRLRLRDGADEPPEAGAWFSAGFARFVAREVLLDLGTLAPDDIADELNVHQAELATAPLRAAPLAALATAAASGDPDAHALLLARGVLLATRIDAELRRKHRGARSLRDLLRALVGEARQANLAELPRSAFTDRLRAELGDVELALFTRALDGGPLPLPADALGPCFVRAPRKYTRFDLGFDEPGSRAATPPRVLGLRPGGPAARAGVREGERLLSLSSTPGDPDTHAHLTLERDGREVDLSYRPAGPSARGDAWRRRPDLDDARCPR